MALRVLSSGEERLYGQTLLKLLDDFSEKQFCPSLVPVLNNKNEIKRRITMISQFKPVSYASWVFLAATVPALCLLTFTRAADPVTKAKSMPKTEGAPASATTEASSEADLRRLRQRFDELDQRILSQEAAVDDLRRRIGISSEAAEGRSPAGLDAETVRALMHERITAEARAAQLQNLYDRLRELGSKSETELAQAIPTALPDAELVRLLADLNQAEAQKARLGVEYGSRSPNMESLSANITALQNQVKARVDGIMKGLGAQIASQNASSAQIKEQLAKNIQQDARLTEEYRPYFRAKRDLEILQNVRNSLMQQILEKEYFIPDPTSVKP
jgi:hypothetical protein